MEPDPLTDQVASGRWSVEQVLAVAPSPAATAAAEAFAEAARWSAAGADDRAVWGRCSGSSREPYDVAVDHVGVGWRCSCPSRVRPCKHALALLLRWVRGEIAPATPPPAVASWVERRAATDAAAGRGAEPAAGPSSTERPVPGRELRGEGGTGEGGTGDERADGHGADDSRPDEGGGSSTRPDPEPEARDRGRDERLARMRAGLVELDRWLEDRMRTGLTDPALGRYATWDELAARLVDARAGALANRVRRIAGLVGASGDWHERVLVELGLLHLLVQGGLRVGCADDQAPVDTPLTEAERVAARDLLDAVAVASGWQVRQADVLAGVPESDDWVVAGRSDTREDRIEVRRIWLWGRTGRRWAMLLSFAAYGQGLDDSLRVGEVHRADLFRYPGNGLRALLGQVREPLTDEAPATPEPIDVVGACDAVGEVLSREPWLERHSVTVRAAPTVAAGRWVLTDSTGSLPLVGEQSALATLVADSLGAAVPITVEWTPHGVLPLTVHHLDRSVDIGPRADPSFVASGS